MSTKELEGRVALVTGGGRNIGRAISLSLAEAGAAVIVNYRTSRAEADETVAEILAAGGKAVAAGADVTDEDAVRRMVVAGVKEFGGIDILVNNAAVRDVTKIDEIDLATWRYVTGIILDGAFICSKCCLTPLRKSTQGTIINIGGLSGHTGAAGRPHVIAAKLGLVGLTRGLSHDLAPDGITVNCVVPGLIDTQRGAASGAKSAHKANSLLGRRGTTDEVASTVRFLAGPAARFVTGQDWHVNGGAYLG